MKLLKQSNGKQIENGMGVIGKSSLIYQNLCNAGAKNTNL